MGADRATPDLTVRLRAQEQGCARQEGGAVGERVAYGVEDRRRGARREVERGPGGEASGLRGPSAVHLRVSGPHMPQTHDEAHGHDPRSAQVGESKADVEDEAGP